MRLLPLPRRGFKATDGTSMAGSRAYTVEIAAVALTLHSSTLDNGIVGSSLYSQTITVATSPPRA